MTNGYVAAAAATDVVCRAVGRCHVVRAAGSVQRACTYAWLAETRGSDRTVMGRMALGDRSRHSTRSVYLARPGILPTMRP